MNILMELKKYVFENNISQLDLLLKEKIQWQLDFVLVLACMDGKLDIVKYLKKNNVDILANGDNNFNFACLYNNLSIVKYFIKEGFDFPLKATKYIESCSQYSHLDLTLYLLDYSEKLNLNISIDIAQPYFSEDLNQTLDKYQLQKKLGKELPFPNSIISNNKVKI